MQKSFEENLIELHKLHFAKIVELLYRKCGDRELACDIAQDTFKTGIEKKAELEGHPNLAGWLYVTAYNKLKNELSRMRIQNEVSIEALEMTEYFESFERLEYVLPKELSDSEKEIIIMRIEKQLDYPEIARIRGITENAARLKFSRAFRKCKELMKKS